MRKNIKKGMALLMTLTMATGLFSGCGSKTENTTEDGEESKVVQVKMYKAGYSDEWLTAMIEAFEETYKEEGYKVEILESSATTSGSSEQEILLGPGKNETDLYFVSGISVDKMIDGSKKVLRTEDEVLLESLEDVYNSPAIGKDKKEESKTIAERLYFGDDSCLYYTGSKEQWQNIPYCISWGAGTTGLVMNNSVMEKYGLSMPLTSDELAETLEAVYNKGKAEGVYPYAWAGNNAPGYWSYLFENWFAQYSGVEAYNNFWATIPASGDVNNDGWQVYEDNGILESLKGMEKIMNLDYATDGAVNMTHLEAQHQLLTGKAAFMVSGDWLLCEMKNEYFDEASNMTMIKTPVLSAIGKEIGIDDASLHTVVEMIDNGSDNDAIKSSVKAINDEGIERVRNARNMYTSIGNSHVAVIPSYSDAKTAAKAFLRFIYSEDGCRIYRENAYAELPIASENAEGLETNFQESLINVTNNGTATALFENSNASKVRSNAGMLLFNYSGCASPNTFVTMMKEEKFTADYIYEKELAYVKANWETYMSYVGE